jgi:hypothetical protein
MRDESGNWYDTGQICVNGHVANWAIKRYPERNQKHCSVCGAQTVTECASCRQPIRGEYHVEGLTRLGGWKAPTPAFCLGCGAPYPWTRASLDAARELAAELHNLSEADRAELAKSLPDLVANTPRTIVAATRFKRLISKAGAEAGSAFEKILVNVVAEAAKKLIWP